MTRGRDGVAHRELRTLFDGGASGHLSDAQLIDRFLARSGESAESAFSTLVERHGPSVLRVCRSVLGDADAAQDAFQATFLVLIRKAGSVRVRDSLGPWLVAVAYRTASVARSAAARRKAVERDAAEVRSRTEPSDEDFVYAVRAEVDRLADRYRRPILLCYFAGLTHESAARQLGCPVGTVRSRLAWARKQLRGAFLRRGIAPSAALGALIATPTRAAVPTTLLIQTSRAASRLGTVEAAGLFPAASAQADRIVRAMFMTKLKEIAAAVLTLGLVATGGIVLAQQATPESANAEKRAGPGLAPGPQTGTKSSDRLIMPGPGPSTPTVRPDVEIEMLLRAAREQEQAGQLDQALALTARMEVILRGWRANLGQEAGPPTTPVSAVAPRLSMGADRPDQPNVTGGNPKGPDTSAPGVSLPLAGGRSTRLPNIASRLAALEARFGHEPPEKYTKEDILDGLEKRVTFHFAEPILLIEATSAIQRAIPVPVPMWFDKDPAQGKMNVGIKNFATLDVEDVPAGVALREVLRQKGLTYHVEAGRIDLVPDRTPAAPTGP